jgi:hypothetical protein
VGVRRIWQDRILGRGDKICRQYLEEYRKPPSPHSPKIMVLIQNYLALSHEFKTPHTPRLNLPPGVSRSNIGQMIIARLELHNFLDPLRMNLGWTRNNIFSPVGQMERVVLGGVVHEGNAMDRRFTRFPAVSYSMINEMGGGSYQADLARQYTTAFRAREVIQQATQWVDIDTFHQLREQGLQDLPCSFFDQVLPPVVSGSPTSRADTLVPVVTASSLPTFLTMSQLTLHRTCLLCLGGLSSTQGHGTKPGAAENHHALLWASCSGKTHLQDWCSHCCAVCSHNVLCVRDGTPLTQP